MLCPKCGQLMLFQALIPPAGPLRKPFSTLRSVRLLQLVHLPGWFVLRA
jgi:hypothetical protein